MLTKSLSTSIIISVFLIGCGGEIKEQSSQDVSMPHQVDMSPKKLRDLDPESEEYLNYMKTYSLDSRRLWTSAGDIKLRDYKHQNKDLHYLIFHDSDSNKQTGYYNPWVPKVGADFLIEDGILYKYTGTPGSNEWSWEIINEDQGDIRHEGIQDYYYNNGSLYGVVLNQDWSYNSFLGYYNLYREIEPKKFLEEKYENRWYTVCEIDDDIYFRSYSKNGKKLDKRDMYYNYQFQIGDQMYYTEGGILYDKDWKVITDNLLYEVRDYEAVTIIPKSLLLQIDFDLGKRKNSRIRELNVRDKDWKLLDIAKWPFD